MDNNFNPLFSDVICAKDAINLNETAYCFTYTQMTNLIQQLMDKYPENTFIVYTTGFSAVTVTGKAHDLYKPDKDNCAGLFILSDEEEFAAVPLNVITAITVGDTAVYDDSIMFLDRPNFTDSCDKNIIGAIYNYIPIGINIEMYLGTVVSSSGIVYKNEYGIIVLTDDENGTNPAFINVNNIVAFVPIYSLLESKAAVALSKKSMIQQSTDLIKI